MLCCQITIGDADSGNPMVVKELDKYRMNSDAMLSDLKRWQADSTTMAVDVKSLRLSIDEYERYCA